MGVVGGTNEPQTRGEDVVRGDHLGAHVDDLASDSDAVRYLHNWLASWATDHPCTPLGGSTAFPAPVPHPIGMVADMEARGWLVVRKDPD